VVRHAPYPPDMAPCDFWLFPHLKTQLKGTRFESRDIIIRKTTAKLYSIRKRHSRNAANNGGTAGTSVFSHKETASKGIRVADLQACKCIFPDQVSFIIIIDYGVFKDEVRGLLCVESNERVISLNELERK